MNYTGCRKYDKRVVFYKDYSWYFHRLDGPAIEYYNGDRVYYINNLWILYYIYEKHPLVLEYKLLKQIEEL